MRGQSGPLFPLQIQETEKVEAALEIFNAVIDADMYPVEVFHFW